MTFEWPVMLLAVALVPVGVLVYRWIGSADVGGSWPIGSRSRRSRRRRSGAPAALGRDHDPVARPARRWRVRVPGALFVLGALILSLSLARPHSESACHASRAP